jgi:type IV secretion system protein VirB3
MSAKLEYPSYNGLSRVAMIRGIPLMAVVVIALASLVIGFVGTAFLGIGGILFGAVGLPFLLYIKQICETDDQALRIAWLEFRCWLTRKFSPRFGGTYTLSPMQYGRRSHVYKRYFKESTRK